MSNKPYFDISNINTILWDWNGTLLDDVGICIDAINTLLVERQHSPLSVSNYKGIFTFPVKEYYKKAGFNFEQESFDKVAIEFIDLYSKQVKGTTVFPEVPDILAQFKKAGFRQYVVSAMEHDFLKDTLSSKGVISLLDGFSGISDHFAKSKVDMAKQFIQNNQINPKTSCLIGDTLHDFDVAETLGIACLLVSSGHQAGERLKQSGVPVFNSLREVSSFFQFNHSEINIK